MNKLKSTISLLLFCMCAFLLMGCSVKISSGGNGGLSSSEAQETVESMPSDASTPITVKLILSKAPRLNEQAELTFIISTISDSPSVNATIVLPEGTSLINGNLKWSGAIKATESHTMKATIMFVSEGNKTIEAKALYAVDNGDVWGDSAYLYLNTTATSGKNGFSTEQNPSFSSKQETLPSITPTNP